MVLGPFAEPTGPRLPGRHPASPAQPNHSQRGKCEWNQEFFFAPNKAEVYRNDYNSNLIPKFLLDVFSEGVWGH